MTDIPTLLIEDFREKARADDSFKANVISDGRTFDTEVKVSEEVDRGLIFTISTPDVDRAGDIVSVKGWKLDEYQKNPQVLWSHDTTGLPVAKGKVWIADNKLKAQAIFTPPGVLRFNDAVFDLYKAGFLSATSVGFLPTKYSLSKDPQRPYGIDFHEQTLLEFSCCTVPMNANALIEARSAGLDVAPLVERELDRILRNVSAGDLPDLVDILAEKVGKIAMDKAVHARIGHAARSYERELRRKRMERDLDLARAKSF